MPDVINFYSMSGEYGCFSNFSRHAVFLKGKRWRTSEHYFQAQKFEGTEYEEAVRMCKKPSEAANRGRSRKLPLRRDWESVKDEVMLEAVRAKFAQHEDLKAILLGTGEALLVEHTANDSYWGDGGDGSGKNMLGQILMRVRAELRDFSADKCPVCHAVVSGGNPSGHWDCKGTAGSLYVAKCEGCGVDLVGTGRAGGEVREVIIWSRV